MTYKLIFKPKGRCGEVIEQSRSKKKIRFLFGEYRMAFATALERGGKLSVEPDVDGEFLEA